LIKGKPFTKANLFDSYIDHFYKIKKDAINETEKYLAKMALNQIYG